MTRPPRVAESLLAALLPSGDCRETVLGDLAEEHADRVATYGVGAAARWYWRESMRTVPHAMRAWLRGLRYPEAALLMMIAPAMLVVGQLFQYSLMALVVWSWGTVPDSWNILFAAWRDVREFRPVVAHTVFAAGWLIPIASGYIAARLDRRAPLAGAIAVGVLQVLLGLVGIGVRPPSTTPGSLALFILMLSGWLASAMSGGMLGVWRGAVIDAPHVHAARPGRIPLH